MITVWTPVIILFFDAPLGQQNPKASVEYESPPWIETTNRLQNLEDMGADQEGLEGDASDSEEYRHPTKMA